MSDVERMGDHAVSIVEGDHSYEGEQRIPFCWRRNQKDGTRRENFVEAALDLYLNGSVDQTYEVAAMDEKSTITLIASVIWLQKKLRKSQAIVTGRDYFQVISFLERIGDYAKNICEWVVYFETGKIVEL